MAVRAAERAPVHHDRDGPDAPRLYERYGWRYRFNDHYSGTFAIRSVKHHRADFLEFGAGYVTRWR